MQIVLINDKYYSVKINLLDGDKVIFLLFLPLLSFFPLHAWHPCPLRSHNANEICKCD